jgi:hypothetical protein
MGGLAAAFVASGATIMTGGGALAAIIGATVAGGGAGALIEVLGKRAGSEREQFLQEQIEKGGILLWIKIKEPTDETLAREILKRHNATNILRHELMPGRAT